MGEGNYIGSRAIIIGASHAGLCAARVLSDHFEEVLLFEKDARPDGYVTHPGVPAGKHIHVLQAGAQMLLEEMFPASSPLGSFRDQMVAAGSVHFDSGVGFRVFGPGGYNRKEPLGIEVLTQTRPLIEETIRKNIDAISNVACLWQQRVSGLYSEGDGVIGGVTLRDPSGDDVMEADFVVDASGRGSRGITWLEALGYSAPPSSEINIGIKYTTVLFERAEDPKREEWGFVIRDFPRTKIGTSLIAVENDQWLVSVSGRLGQVPRDGLDGLMQDMKELATPDVYDILKDCPVTVPPTSFNFPSNLWHHFDKMDAFPEGFATIGDAVISLNPLYGQGMTSGVSQAKILGQTFQTLKDQGRAISGAAESFRLAQATFVVEPWMRAAIGDFVFPEATGDKPENFAEEIAFNQALMSVAKDDRELRLKIMRVNQFLDPPETIREGDIGNRVRAEMERLAAD